MRAMELLRIWRRIGFLLVAVFSSCWLAQDYKECLYDSDCAPVNGSKLSCTSDHLCVAGTPAEQLCREVYPASAPPDAVPIGTLIQLSDAGWMNNLLLQTIKMGVDEINALNGSDAPWLVLHICEATEDLDNLKAMRVLLYDRKVVAVIGPHRSSTVIEIAAESAAQQVPLISPSAGAAAISGLPQVGFIFRTYPSEVEEAQVMADLVSRDQPLALMGVADVFGNGYRTIFLQSWFDPSRKNMPLVSATWAAGNLTDLENKAQLVLARDPVNVVAAATVDTSALVSQLVGLDRGASIYLSSASKGPALLESAKSLPSHHTRRIYGIAPMAPPGLPELASFRASFAFHFDGLDPSQNLFSSYTYDAFYAAAIAIRSLPRAPTGATVAQALRRIRSDGPSAAVGPASFLEAVNQLRAGQLLLRGTTGTLGFSENGDRQGSSYERWSIDRDSTTPRFAEIPISR